MAQELRQELLRDTVADGTVTANAGSEFRNDSSAIIHIRGMDILARIDAAGPTEYIAIEVSKAPVYQGSTNNSPFFRKEVEVHVNTSVALDTSASNQNSWRWGKGQLTLEPNESLFMNTFKTTGGVSLGKCDLEYEFG